MNVDDSHSKRDPDIHKQDGEESKHSLGAVTVLNETTRWKASVFVHVRQLREVF